MCERVCSEIERQWECPLNSYLGLNVSRVAVSHFPAVYVNIFTQTKGISSCMTFAERKRRPEKFRMCCTQHFTKFIHFFFFFLRESGLLLDLKMFTCLPLKKLFHFKHLVKSVETVFTGRRDDLLTQCVCVTGHF